MRLPRLRVGKLKVLYVTYVGICFDLAVLLATYVLGKNHANKYVNTQVTQTRNPGDKPMGHLLLGIKLNTVGIIPSI